MLRGPCHDREPLGRDRERRPAAAELGLDLERAPLLGPVVLDHVAHDPRAEVSKRDIHQAVFRGLLKHQAVGRLSVGYPWSSFLVIALGSRCRRNLLEPRGAEVGYDPSHALGVFAEALRRLLGVALPLPRLG